jgi:hypothetical protein
VQPLVRGVHLLGAVDRDQQDPAVTALEAQVGVVGDV